jgi:hypothetical protein
MRAWLLVCLVAGGCGSSSVSFSDYPDAFRDAYCKYLTRCGVFPDTGTCENANTDLDIFVDASAQAAVDMGKVVFDGETAQKCLDEFGAQTCDTTDESGRAFPASCDHIIQGTVDAGGACAFSEECKSGMCDVPACSMACCQGTCVGDAPPPPGGPGAMCSTSGDCTDDSFCDFSLNVPVCTALKPSGAACQATSQCAYGLGCAGATCKPLPKLGEPCPDGVCRDAGNYFNAAGTCAQIGLAGDACTSNDDCSPFYPCDTTTMTCTQGPQTGEACAMGQRCFDADTFCDTSAAAPTCVTRRPDGGTCTSNSQCESHNCDQTGSAGTCTEEAVCI